MLKDDEIRMRHMLDAAREAQGFAAGKTRADLGRDRQLVLVLVKEIEIIGEAASRVSVVTQASLPGIPWPQIIGMRHHLIHAYFDIDVDIVWNVVTQNLPALIRELEGALSAPGA